VRHADPTLRPAAAAFLAAALPLALAIALAGGALALVPLALLLIPVLVTGRAPGVERLQSLRPRPSARRRRPEGSAPRRRAPRRWTSGGLLIAASLSKRGPPLIT
jgi:hypothetical protein